MGQGKDPKQKIQTQRLVGNDKDSHGCLTSAGYQWSELLKDCIRPFEKGIRLDPTSNNTENGMTCLVFNADSSQVEVFLPAVIRHPILQRQPSLDTWNSDSESGIVARREGLVWTVSVDGMVKYRSR